ncbi:serine carboxypeptidase S28 [Seiridium cupressi]
MYDKLESLVLSKRTNSPFYRVKHLALARGRLPPRPYPPPQLRTSRPSNLGRHRPSFDESPSRLRRGQAWTAVLGGSYYFHNLLPQNYLLLSEPINFLEAGSIGSSNMRIVALFPLFLGAISFHGVFGVFPKRPLIERLTLEEHEVRRLMDRSDPLTGNGTFEQPIDHNDASLGTFQQSYWYNTTFWKGPGSPIVLMTPGESAAAPYAAYLTDRAITGMYAQAIGGAVVMIEHRYWGNSTPYDTQTTMNLQYLTLDQAVADFVNFAQNVKLPFDTSGATNAPKAPWVWVGGSYAGALAAWIEKLSPGVFWAYHSSSGPVEAIYDFWSYFSPIQSGMPQNCSRDYSAIVDHVDDVFTNGSPQDKASLKAMFAVVDLDHDDDAASAITSPIFYWQEISFTSNYSQFYQMCDAIEGAGSGLNGTFSGDGVGLSKALPNFAAWFKSEYLPDYCDSYGYSDWAGPMNVQCWNTYDTSMQVYDDLSANNAVDRTWIWMTCNEPFFYWQTGAPPDQPSLLTRLANAEYYQRQCANWFPPQGSSSFASSEGKTEVQVNSHTGGWSNTHTTRLLFSNGEFDPWRSASVSSTFRPGGPLNSTADVPVILINGSRHCTDLSKKNAINPAIAAAQDAEISQISDWVAEFYAQNKTDSNGDGGNSGNSGSGNGNATTVPPSQGLGWRNDQDMYLVFLGLALVVLSTFYD